MHFQISLADKIIEIDSIYEHVYHMCRDYLVDPMAEKADIRIPICDADIELERKKSVKEYESQFFSDSYLETLAVYRKIAVAMLGYDSWLMHGAVFALQDSACMLTAVSGTGKTTVLQMVLKQMEGSYVVNGDKPLLQIRDRRVYACGTPWAGKEHMNRNCQVPLKAIFILERGNENKAEELSFGQAFSVLLQQTYKPDTVAGMKKTLELLSRLGNPASGVKFYRLSVKRYDNRKDLENEEVLSLLQQMM